MPAQLAGKLNISHKTSGIGKTKIYINVTRAKIHATWRRIVEKIGMKNKYPVKTTETTHINVFTAR